MSRRTPPASPRFDQPLTAWQAVGRILACASALLLGLWLSAALAADVVTPSQHGTLANSYATATVAAAVAVTLAPPAAQRVRLYSFTAFCNAGAASASVTNSTSGATLWLSDPAYITASARMTNFQPPLTGPVGSTLVVTVGACGTAATQFGKVSVQADYDGP